MEHLPAAIVIAALILALGFIGGCAFISNAMDRILKGTRNGKEEGVSE